MRRHILAILITCACGPDDTDSQTDVVDPHPGAVFLCCGHGSSVMCSQGACTADGYCPIACDIEDEFACGEPAWATCQHSPEHGFSICVKTEPAGCEPEH